jgi:hypothetical protein
VSTLTASQPGLTGRVLFAAIAPRLERAHRQRIDELVREARHRRHVRDRVLRAERMVAHRELQLARATGVKGDGSYYVHRRRKLEQGRKELARLRRLAKKIGA